MTWCFRARFDLSPRSKLQYEGAEWLIADDAPVRVVLRPTDGETNIADARRLSLRGSGYATEPDAEVAGRQWRDRLIMAFARINVAADFGGRSPQGGFTAHALAEASRASGQPVLNDVHGLMTFECEPQPRFLRLGPITGVVSSPHQRLTEAMDATVRLDAAITSRERLAYGLYAASFSETSADARFVMLMMAIETLIQPQPRSEDARALVDTLIQATRSSPLPANEIASIVGALDWLHSESINKAGRRLASRLGDRTYQGETPERFFTRCYDLRSRLVHGAEPRPSRAEIEERAANLEHFVGDLISGPLLDNS